jgi:hypothetical protein
MGTAQRELCVAQWLERNAIPTVKVYGIENQPLLIEGYPVTFWRAFAGLYDGSHRDDDWRASFPFPLPATGNTESTAATRLKKSSALVSRVVSCFTFV